MLINLDSLFVKDGNMGQQEYRNREDAGSEREGVGKTEETVGGGEESIDPNILKGTFFKDKIPNEDTDALVYDKLEQITLKNKIPLKYDKLRISQGDREETFTIDDRATKYNNPTSSLVNLEKFTKETTNPNPDQSDPEKPE